MKGQFRASNLPYAARQAARANGLATVGSYDILSHVRIVDEELDADKMQIATIRAYSPAGTKSVDIIAGDIFCFETLYQDAPAARVR